MATLPILPTAGDEITALWGQQVAGLIAKLLDPKYQQSGTATVPNSGAPTGTVTVTFPIPFDNAPMVFAAITTSSHQYLLAAVPSNATTATINVRHVSGNMSTNVGVRWFAIDLAYLRA